MTDWAHTEARVRQIAEANWSAPCRPREFAGVRYDAVIEHRPDYLIVIEVTNESNLGKLREDIAKLAQIRFSNFSKSIFTDCYFITRDDTTSLKESGAAQNVTVLSVHEFSELFLGSREYIYERTEIQFGSAVDPDSGEKDTTPYTPIEYESSDGSKYNIDRIREGLYSGHHYILLGEFGTGKSRCIQELFHRITSSASAKIIPPLAINLRDNWGLQSFDLIIRHHMNSLGLSKFGDNAVKLARRGRYLLLLDGFDEIGAQSWTGEASRLSEIRKSSLRGIRDLISKSNETGFLIAGREHYFSSDEEMLDCLGVSSNYEILRCPEEFSDDEVRDYLSNTSELTEVPPWMPRKPLICQLLSKIKPHEMSDILSSATGEVEFFERILDAICDRETGIKASVIDKITLKRVLLMLAQYSRRKAESVESISPEEINLIFYNVSGRTPLDESSIILQRLPYLGRVGSGSADRTFIDEYAKNGLRGLSLSDSINTSDRSISSEKWIQPLSEWGCRVLGSKISIDTEMLKFVRYCNAHGNSQVAADYVATALLTLENFADLYGVEVFSSSIDTLDFSNKEVRNMSISNAFINRIIIENSRFDNVRISNCAIPVVIGVGSADKLPILFDDQCRIQHFSDASNVSRISDLKHSNAHKTLIAIIQKLFFQRGGGRKEDALLRGTSEYWQQDAADQVIAYMIANGIAEVGRGREGKLYVPKRKYTRRMAEIVEMQSSSNDELWKILDEK